MHFFVRCLVIFVVMNFAPPVWAQQDQAPSTLKPEQRVDLRVVFTTNVNDPTEETLTPVNNAAVVLTDENDRLTAIGLTNDKGFVVFPRQTEGFIVRVAVAGYELRRIEVPGPTAPGFARWIVYFVRKDGK